MADDAHDANASDARDEYRRALRDYTQLMRHRLANPLTTIISGIATLRELPALDPEARESLLEMMAQHAAELERVALYPVALRPEEQSLLPLADERVGGPEQRSRLRDRRKGMNEAQFRRINDLLAELSDAAHHDVIDFVCECSDNTCAATVQLTIDEYRGVHDAPARFVVEPAHDDPRIEVVTSRSTDWWVVEKVGVARGEVERMAREDHDGVVDGARGQDAERPADAPPTPDS